MAQHDSTYLTVTSRTGLHENSIRCHKMLSGGNQLKLLCMIWYLLCQEVVVSPLRRPINDSCNHTTSSQSRVLIIFKSHHPTQDKIQRKILSNTRYNPTNCHPTTKYLATMNLNSAILLITVLSFSADHACEFCVYLCMDIYEIEWCRHYYRPSSHIVKMILIASFYMFVHTLFSCKATLHSRWRASTPSK